MWLMVMFDLPVVEKAERIAATQFRNTLLDLGFEMTQFSVYMRFVQSQGEVDAYCKRVEGALPEGGRVSILGFTDKQYGRIQTYLGRSRGALKKAPEQFDLF
jgi:CRISPR-associated protein Cas2